MVLQFSLIFCGFSLVLAKTYTNYNEHKPVKSDQTNEANMANQMEVVLTTLKSVMDRNARLENELTRTNKLLNILSTEYSSTKELLYTLTRDYALTKQNMAALTIEHVSTKDELAALTTEHDANIQNLAALIIEHTSTKEELATLTIMHTDTKNRLLALIDDYSTTNRILHTTRTDLDKASFELVKVKRALAHEKERNRQSRIIPPTATAVTTSKPVPQSVAFFAVMTDHQQHLGIHQTVGFQRAVTNVGNGWDGQANVFRAPKAGLYYFSATIMSHYAEDIETELVMKGVPIVYSYDGDKATHGVGTLSAVLNLSVGDDVWIRIYNNPVKNDGNVRVYGGAWSWFSGFLISE
ncbi:Hypothetical predicted protein [Mytilus galloprovincialis]|uniref:C1q domain-containing protein n=1 Tax=Mytilus galloprovincialis TaxID=29158 RepID=A0A8B6G6Z3_MYTGA|nr:Hypothetical predicted protein [Mytilus galloprovincialis]